MPEKSDVERLKHRISQLELLCMEYRAKMKRLAAEATYYAKLCKGIGKDAEIFTNEPGS